MNSRSVAGRRKGGTPWLLWAGLMLVCIGFNAGFLCGWTFAPMEKAVDQVDQVDLVDHVRGWSACFALAGIGRLIEAGREAEIPGYFRRVWVCTPEELAAVETGGGG